MFAPRHTLLLVTRGVLARVDMSGWRRLEIDNVWAQPSTETLPPIAAVATAYKLGPDRHSRVWVLASDFWTGVLSLAADVTPLLSDTELKQALALEAEIDSGISAFASEVGALRLAEPSSSESHWCVTHIEAAEMQLMTAALKPFRAHLVGVAHPAAAQISLQASEGSVDVAQLLPVWDEHFGQAPGDASGTAPATTDAATTDTAVRAWAECWADCLARNPAMPLAIRLDREPLSTSQQVIASAALTLLAAGACMFWNVQTQQHIATVDRSIAGLEQRQKADEATRRQVQTLEAQLAKLRKEATLAETERHALENNLHRADRAHAQQNRRWLALLDSIAQAVDDQCWIQRLESKPIQAIVHGLALDNAAAHRFASALELGLEDSGWTVLPAETRLTEHRMVAFRIILSAGTDSLHNDAVDVAKVSALDRDRSASVPAGGHRE